MFETVMCYNNKNFQTFIVFLGILCIASAATSSGPTSNGKLECLRQSGLQYNLPWLGWLALFSKKKLKIYCGINFYRINMYIKHYKLYTRQQ